MDTMVAEELVTRDTTAFVNLLILFTSCSTEIVTTHAEISVELMTREKTFRGN